MLAKKILGCILLSGLALATACGSSDSGSSGTTSDSGTSGSSGSSGSSGTSGNYGSSGAISSTVTGMVGGKPFSLNGGVGSVAAGYGPLTLVFSSEDRVCESLEDAKLHQGETRVVVYHLTGTAPGTFTGNDNLRYTIVKSSCPSGAPVNPDNVEKSKPVGSKVPNFYIAELTDTAVRGTLDVTFEDGSTVSGEFNLPMCPVAAAQDESCY